MSALRDEGHDVSWIGGVEPGIDDRTVLRRANDEGRVLITFDTDFGTLIFQNDGSRPAGIRLVRLPPLSKDELVHFMVETIADRSDWEGHFAVIEHDQIRMRPLPEGASGVVKPLTFVGTALATLKKRARNVRITSTTAFIFTASVTQPGPGWR